MKVTENIEKHWEKFILNEKNFISFAPRTRKYFQPEITSPVSGKQIGGREVSRCYPGYVGNPATGQCEKAGSQNLPKKERSKSETTSEKDLVNEINAFKQLNSGSWLDKKKCENEIKNCFKPPCNARCLDENLNAALDISSYLFDEKLKDINLEDRKSFLVKKLLANDLSNPSEIDEYLNDTYEQHLTNAHQFKLMERYGLDEKNSVLFSDFYMKMDDFIVRYDRSSDEFKYMGVDRGGKIRYKDTDGSVRINTSFKPCPINKPSSINFSEQDCTDLVSNENDLTNANQDAAVNDFYNFQAQVFEEQGDKLKKQLENLMEKHKCTEGTEGSRECKVLGIVKERLQTFLDGDMKDFLQIINKFYNNQELTQEEQDQIKKWWDNGNGPIALKKTKSSEYARHNIYTEDILNVGGDTNDIGTLNDLMENNRTLFDKIRKFFTPGNVDIKNIRGLRPDSSAKREEIRDKIVQIMQNAKNNPDDPKAKKMILHDKAFSVLDRAVALYEALGLEILSAGSLDGVFSLQLDDRERKELDTDIEDALKIRNGRSEILDLDGDSIDVPMIYFKDDFRNIYTLKDGKNVVNCKDHEGRVKYLREFSNIFARSLAKLNVERPEFVDLTKRFNERIQLKIDEISNQEDPDHIKNQYDMEDIFDDFIREIGAKSNTNRHAVPIVVGMSEARQYLTELAGGKETYLPVSSTFISADKLVVDRGNRTMYVERLDGVSVKAGTRDYPSRVGSPAGAFGYCQYNHVPYVNDFFRHAISNSIGDPYSLSGTTDELLDPNSELTDVLAGSIVNDPSFGINSSSTSVENARDNFIDRLNKKYGLKIKLNKEERSKLSSITSRDDLRSFAKEIVKKHFIDKSRYKGRSNDDSVPEKLRESFSSAIALRNCDGRVKVNKERGVHCENEVSNPEVPKDALEAVVRTVIPTKAFGDEEKIKQFTGSYRSITAAYGGIIDKIKNRGGKAKRAIWKDISPFMRGIPETVDDITLNKKELKAIRKSVQEELVKSRKPGEKFKSDEEIKKMIADKARERRKEPEFKQEMADKKKEIENEVNNDNEIDATKKPKEIEKRIKAATRERNAKLNAEIKQQLIKDEEILSDKETEEYMAKHLEKAENKAKKNKLRDYHKELKRKLDTVLEANKFPPEDRKGLMKDIIKLRNNFTSMGEEYREELESIFGRKNFEVMMESPSVFSQGIVFASNARISKGISLLQHSRHAIGGQGRSIVQTGYATVNGGMDPKNWKFDTGRARDGELKVKYEGPITARFQSDVPYEQFESVQAFREKAEAIARGGSVELDDIDILDTYNNILQSSAGQMFTTKGNIDRYKYALGCDGKPGEERRRCERDASVLALTVGGNFAALFKPYWTDDETYFSSSEEIQQKWQALALACIDSIIRNRDSGAIRFDENGLFEAEEMGNEQGRTAKRGRENLKKNYGYKFKQGEARVYIHPSQVRTKEDFSRIDFTNENISAEEILAAGQKAGIFYSIDDPAFTEAYGGDIIEKAKEIWGKDNVAMSRRVVRGNFSKDDVDAMFAHYQEALANNEQGGEIQTSIEHSMFCSSFATSHEFETGSNIEIFIMGPKSGPTQAVMNDLFKKQRFESEKTYPPFSRLAPIKRIDTPAHPEPKEGFDGISKEKFTGDLISTIERSVTLTDTQKETINSIFSIDDSKLILNPDNEQKFADFLEALLPIEGPDKEALFKLFKYEPENPRKASILDCIDELYVPHKSQLYLVEDFETTQGLPKITDPRRDPKKDRAAQVPPGTNKPLPQVAGSKNPSAPTSSGTMDRKTQKETLKRYGIIQ